MRVIFADTGYWAASLNPRDQFHAKAREVSQALGRFRILTTEMILDELLAALSSGIRQLPNRGRQGMEPHGLLVFRPDAGA